MAAKEVIYFLIWAQLGCASSVKFMSAKSPYCFIPLAPPSKSNRSPSCAESSRKVARGGRGDR
jgi:hypothetical protein